MVGVTKVGPGCLTKVLRGLGMITLHIATDGNVIFLAAFHILSYLLKDLFGYPRLLMKPEKASNTIKTK